MKPFPRVEKGAIIRQEKKQERKEEDKVCTLHSDFVTVEVSDDPGVFWKKMLLVTVVISIKDPPLPLSKNKGHGIGYINSKGRNLRCIYIS